MKFFLRNIFITIFIAVISYSADSFASPKLFNKKETKNSGVNEFPKWIGALEKNKAEHSKYRQKCTENDKRFYCNIADWRKFLDSIAAKPRAEQMKLVNNYANKHKYIVDQINWGVEDYWESPGEFLSKNGDCEDYAIIKYMSLKHLGISQKEMRVVILFDNNLGIYHAVLAVYQPDGGIAILDNQVGGILPDKKIYHYTPVFSLNEENWWTYL